MQPTLLPGDSFLVNKLSYGVRNPFTKKIWIPWGRPRRGDVVVFMFPRDPAKDYVQRLVGLPGEQVQVINKKVYINGQLLEMPQAVTTEPAIFPAPKNVTESLRDNFGPVVVPPDSYFVMGDNRDHSYDSRFWGFVSLDALRGKALYTYLSWVGDHSVPIYKAWHKEGFRIRWNRLGLVIP